MDVGRIKIEDWVMADSPIICRLCKKKMGTVRGFEGKIFSLCVKCEKNRRKVKRRRQT